jgi:hypothetical protein
MLLLTPMDSMTWEGTTYPRGGSGRTAGQVIREKSQVLQLFRAPPSMAKANKGEE